MRTFSDINPFMLFIYFIIVTCFPFLIQNGYIYLISLLGSFVYFIFLNGYNDKKTHGVYVIFFLIMTIINPIISHNGETVLFVVNNSPITLEALIYGFFSSVLIISVMYWFRIFFHIMTSDKIFYIFDRFSPKLALIFSMGLRYIPLFKRQWHKIKQGQMILGSYKDGNIIDRFFVSIKTFSVLVTWTLENGIITSESMDARGYGIGKRSRINNFPVLVSDVIFMFFSIILLVFSFLFIKDSTFVFYPKFQIKTSPMSFWGCLFYFILVLIPILLDTKEKIKWKYLEQKI